MTRYILGGGGEAKVGGGGPFCSAIRGNHQGKLHILDCFFAEPPETWEEKFTRKAKTFFGGHMPGEFECELARPDSFVQQVARADVVYLHGGDERVLAKSLKQFRLPQLWQGKTVVGTSAGAMFLSAVSWGCDRRTVANGSGLVQVGVIVHYASDYGSDAPEGPVDWQKAKTDLVAQSPNGLPIFALGEGEFVAFETNP